MKKAAVFIAIFFGLVILIRAQTVNKKWQTYFEKSNYTGTPNYEETIEYFNKLADATPYMKMIPFGESPQGRTLYAAVVSEYKLFTPSEIKKKSIPILLIQNGIHAGEIEGKDACMLLLRDILITKSKENYIDNCVLIIIPVFNVDGHERRSPYNRVNQNGPAEMGWRTTAQNFNLNRDYMKADTPEMQSWLKFFNEWLPDFFIDTHTTDGADYQYTITYNISTGQNQYPQTVEWIQNSLVPYFEKKVQNDGYLISPYISFKGRKLEDGLEDWIATPRFSNGYTPIQNRPGLLIETHMLKSYKDRVYSTKSLIEAVIEKINVDGEKLVDLNRDADKWVIKNYYEENNYLPLTFETSEKYKMVFFKGIESDEKESWITGSKIVHYTGIPFEKEIPFYFGNKVKDSITVPTAYIIPREWNDIVDRMKLHGIKIDTVKSTQNVIVERYKFSDVKFASRSFEGHQMPIYSYEVTRDTIKTKPGDFLVRTNQRMLEVIANLLEPLGPDSFAEWGFFNTIFERKEYFEMYSMEPVAEKMTEENPKLKEEFLETVKKDENLKNNPRARLQYFYERSEYFDHQLNVYPVLRVVSELSD